MDLYIEPTSSINVLIVDDDQDDIYIIKRIFSQITEPHFIVDATSSYKEAQDSIIEEKHDIYLIDYRLGEKTGLDLLEFADAGKRKQPFVLLTGAGDHSIEMQSMRLAASDYLVKGSFNADTLSRTMQYALQRKLIEQERIDYLLQLNQSKDEFISLASHQLRTPATGVKQYVGMLLEGFFGEIEPNQKNVLQKAYESNERQLRIVSDLLKVAQVDAGKVLLKKTNVSANDLINDVINEQQDTYVSRQQSIVYTPLDPDVTLYVDINSIRMVLENLVDNASKYSNEGTTVTVSIEEQGNDYCIVVHDEGVGIDESKAEHLFEKFIRLDNPLSTRVGGTGLGLYWAKKIMNLHDGTIVYRKNKQSGTSFVICIPKKSPL